MSNTNNCIICKVCKRCLTFGSELGVCLKNNLNNPKEVICENCLMIEQLNFVEQNIKLISKTSLVSLTTRLDMSITKAMLNEVMIPAVSE